MSKKSVNIITIVIVSLFVFTVAFLAAGVAIDYHDGPQRAEKIFEELSKCTESILATSQAGTQKFCDDVKAQYVLADDIQSITIDVSGQTVYKYPSSAITQDDALLSAKTYSKSIGTPGNTVNLTAQIYLLKPAAIYSRARMSFFLTLGGTIAAAILLVYVSLSDKRPHDSGKRTEKSDDIEYADLQKKMSEYLKELQKESSAEQDKEAEVKAKENINTEMPKESESKPDTKDESVVETTEGISAAGAAFNSEEHLTPRLNTELVSAASSAQDIALFIVRIPGFDRSAGATEEIYSLFLSQFALPDMLFEYKSDGFAAIKLNEALDPAIERAQDVQSGVSSILSKRGINSSCFIGISARSSRIISAERLQNEAEQAASRAMEDKNAPIIAFRVNPDKYRKYLAETAKVAAKH